MCSGRLPRSLAGCFTTASCLWWGACAWEVPLESWMCPTCAGGIPAATKTEWHCCLCPSSNAQDMHHATGFVARMGWDAEPEICANVTLPQGPPHGKISEGKRGYMQERGMCQQTNPSPCGQGVFRTAHGFKMKHMLKCSVRNLMLLPMWAAAQLSQSKLSGKLTGCLFA